jgi:TPR repeat protein
LWIYKYHTTKESVTIRRSSSKTQTSKMSSRQERRALSRKPTPTDWWNQEADPSKMLAAIGGCGVASRAANGDTGAYYTIACERLQRITTLTEQAKKKDEDEYTGLRTEKEKFKLAVYVGDEEGFAKIELEYASNRGHVYATERLGDVYRDGGDFEAAKKWYTKAAVVGLPSAMFKLGRSLESGEGGLELDAPAAAEWYRKAIGSGHAGAACNLRFMRAVGRGVARSKRLEMVALRKAAENGDTDAAVEFVHAIHTEQPYARETAAWSADEHCWPQWCTAILDKEALDASLAWVDANGGDTYCCNIGCKVVRPRKHFKVCPQCKFYRYCGPTCQAADWVAGGHKHRCGTYQANFDQR